MTTQLTDEEQKKKAEELEARAKELTKKLAEKNQAFDRKCGTLIYESNKELDKIESFMDEKEKEFDEFEEKKKKELKEAEEKYDISLSKSEKEAYDLEDDINDEAIQENEPSVLEVNKDKE